MDSDASDYSDMEDLVSQAMNSVSKCVKSLKKQSKTVSGGEQSDSGSDAEAGCSSDYIKATTSTSGHRVTVPPVQSTASSAKSEKKKHSKSGATSEMSALPDKEFQVEPLPPHQSWRQRRKQYRREKASSKGKNWFHMRAEEMTEDKKNDLKVLQMRSALDSKTFYKANDRKVLPKFFQIGTWVDSPNDFYNRVPKRKRKQTIVEELLEDAEFRKYNKRKHAEIMEAQRRGTGPYKKQKFAKRLKKKFK